MRKTRLGVRNWLLKPDYCPKMLLELKCTIAPKPFYSLDRKDGSLASSEVLSEPHTVFPFTPSTQLSPIRRSLPFCVSAHSQSHGTPNDVGSPSPKMIKKAHHQGFQAHQDLFVSWNKPIDAYQASSAFLLVRNPRTQNAKREYKSGQIK